MPRGSDLIQAPPIGPLGAGNAHHVIVVCTSVFFKVWSASTRPGVIGMAIVVARIYQAALFRRVPDSVGVLPFYS